MLIDRDLVVKLAEGTTTLFFTGWGPGTQPEHPEKVRRFNAVRLGVDEVVLESWSLRTRRLEATDDDVSFPKAIKNIKRMVNHNGTVETAFNEKFDALLEEWKHLREPSSQLMLINKNDPDSSQTIDSTQLVEAWRNGEMFHGDADKKIRPEVTDFNELFVQVCMHTARVTLLAIGALNVIRKAVASAELELPSECFEEQVVYDPKAGVMRGFMQVQQVGPRVFIPKPKEDEASDESSS